MRTLIPAIRPWRFALSWPLPRPPPPPTPRPRRSAVCHQKIAATTADSTSSARSSHGRRSRWRLTPRGFTSTAGRAAATMRRRCFSSTAWRAPPSPSSTRCSRSRREATAPCRTRGGAHQVSARMGASQAPSAPGDGHRLPRAPASLGQAAACAALPRPHRARCRHRLPVCRGAASAVLLARGVAARLRSLHRAPQDPLAHVPPLRRWTGRPPGATLRTAPPAPRRLARAV